MNLKRLKHFVGVVDARNFHRAAAALCITQPALSISIRALEQEFDTRLLDRTPDAVIPTARGEVLYSHALALLRDADVARNAVLGLDDSADRVLRFGIGKAISTSGLALALQNLKQHFPKVRPHAISNTYAELAPRLLTGELDFLLTRLPDTPDDINFEYRHLFSDPHVVIAKADHPLVQPGKKATLKQLIAFPWVYGEPFEDVIANWAEPFRKKRLTPPQPTLHADSYELIRAILLSSDALSIMPLQLVVDDLQLGRLVKLDIVERLPWVQRCGLTLRKHRTAPPIVEHFLEELVACFDEAQSENQ